MTGKVVLGWDSEWTGKPWPSQGDYLGMVPGR